MPNNEYFSDELIKAGLAVGNFTENRLRDSCQRIMSGWYKIPADKRFPCNGGDCVKNNVSTPVHKQLARKLSAMSTVLVQNNGDLLPLAKTGLKIALIGSDAVKPYTAGSGSGGVPNSNVAVSPYDAFQRIAGITVVYDAGNTTSADAARVAAAADVAIIFGSAKSGEGKDRIDLLFTAPPVAGTVRVFRQKFTLEDAIGSQACSLEANMRVTNGIPLGSSLLLSVFTVNCVQPLKVLLL
jgi:beta-glucosidase